MTQKDIFRQWLTERFPDVVDTFIPKFEAYHSWLVDENAKINLISRRVEPGDIWTLHFLDSLLSVRHVDFRGRKILDFGTGGGLPGLPLAILYEDSEVTLLDSTKKKIAAITRAAEHLKLKNCRFIDKRIEETGRQYQTRFDIIVSRSVKIEPAYKPILLGLLEPQGKLVLYKSKNLDDIRQFNDYGVNIFDANTATIGERKIIVITKDTP